MSDIIRKIKIIQMPFIYHFLIGENLKVWLDSVGKAVKQPLLSYVAVGNANDYNSIGWQFVNV